MTARAASLAPRRPGRAGALAARLALASYLVLAALAGCAPPEGADVVPLDHYRESLDRLKTQDFPQTTRIVDREGRLLAELAPEGHRIWVGLDEMPESLKRAVVATEDRTFFSNAGVDKKAVARAALQNAEAGDTVSGASTITMQLVRLVAFDEDERYEQSVERKLREVYLAAEIDEAYSKDEILEAYLNVAYFGRGAYGVEAAARRWFGIPARDLSLPEAALLAGLLQAPTALDPVANPGGARERQRIVLDRLVDVGAIPSEAADEAFSSPVVFIEEPPAPERLRSHSLDYLVSQLPAVLGEDRARRGGLVITTTLDLALEEEVRRIARGHVAGIAERHDVSDAAVVVLEPETGHLLAMVRGLDYEEPRNGQVNAADSPRQPGSAFKPIAYAAALEAGWTPEHVVWDVPLLFPGDGIGSSESWPVNYDGRYRGPLRLREALANSLNGAAVSLAGELGVEKAHALAQRMGMPLDDDPDRYGLSLVLGSAELPLVSLTAALGSFGRGGRLAAPTAVLAATTLHDGEPVPLRLPVPKPVVSPETAFLISDILSDDAARRDAFGPGNPLETEFGAAVKTGTSNDFRDNLTIGWTPEVAVGVWTGNKDGRPMRDVLGITGAAPIWHDVLEETLRRRGVEPGDPFQRPEGMLRAELCEIPGTIAADGRCRRRESWLAAGSPTTDAELTYGFFVARRRADGAACAERVDAGEGGTMRLLRPRSGQVAGAARAWSSGRGMLVADAPCAGAETANAARLRRAPVAEGPESALREPSP